MPKRLSEAEHQQRLNNVIAIANGRKLETHCKHGHEFTPENTYIRPNGRRQCRTCTNDRTREYQQTVTRLTKLKIARYEFTDEQKTEIAEIMCLNWGGHMQTGIDLGTGQPYLYTKMGPSFPAKRHMIARDGEVFHG